MVKKIEQKIVFSSPEDIKITNANLKISDDGKNVEINIISELTEEQKPNVLNTGKNDEDFPIIDPSELIRHKLLSYQPETKRQIRLFTDIMRGIQLKLPAFRVPCMDPSEEEGKIIFKAGNMPIVGHSPIWWDKILKEFNPEKNSRIGTDLHWAAFMGKQMRYLIDEKNYSIEDAWKAICDDSRDLGHYWNSRNTKHDFEPTGSRKVGDFFDLANTGKIIKDSRTTKFLFAGGRFKDNSYSDPLAKLSSICPPYYNYYYSVGWLVLDV